MSTITIDYVSCFSMAVSLSIFFDYMKDLPTSEGSSLWFEAGCVVRKT
jgi:hypothetical protein